MQNIIECSIQRNDTIHLHLQQALASDPTVTMKFHNTCVSSYTSKRHIQRYLKHMMEQQRRNMGHPPKRRSHKPHFDFRRNCFICGDKCLHVNLK